MRKKIYLMRPVVGNDEINEIKKVIKSKFLTEGEITRKFESSVAKYVKAKFGIATTSATTALHTSLECMNVRKKKVLVSDFTFPATADAILLAGGIPTLLDVDKDTMNVTRDIVEGSLESNIEHIVPVSLFGNPLENHFYKLKKSGLKIIEDAATNLGTKIGDDFVGSLANVTCFSFHPRKIITTGEGGMITTDDKKLDTRFRTFKKFGTVQDSFITIGTNYKISDVLSAIGIVQLKKIETIIKKRRIMAKFYSELFSKIDFIELQQTTHNGRHTYQSFACYVSKNNLRDKIRKNLAKNNIETQIGTYALHCLPAFKNCLRKGKLQNSEFLYKNSLSIPLHEELSESDQEYICNIIKKSL